MARGGGLIRAFIHVQRANQRLALQEQRRQKALVREAERAQRAAERARAANEKEQARLYVESRLAEVESKNEDLRDAVSQLESLLDEALRTDSLLDFEKMKEPLVIPKFDSGPLGIPEPVPILESYLPRPLTTVGRLIPGAAKRHNDQVACARTTYEAAFKAYVERERIRKAKLEEAIAEHHQKAEDLKAKVATQHKEIDELKRDFEEGKREAITAYFSAVLATSAYPESFPHHWKIAFVPESRQLVLEYQLPTSGVVPTVGSYKYIKARDEIAETARPAAQHRALYASVVAQITLRSLHETFEADPSGKVETVIVNGYVDTIDEATGRPVTPCLVTVRTTRETFQNLDLRKVEPIACLHGLHASFSKSPAELVPVRPVLEFNMVDPRFIEKIDVLSSLDQRPNLMQLSPGEFEALITNLFEKMGLETRLTQPSRDGGVDCVAYDPRPIFGGKVVIQAKRYRHTVGVSAVRDLFGTMQNEGASKGILVTTSGYGKAAFEFAAGKPIELLSGSNLLYLLAEHAGMEAKIEVPEDWKDPLPDVPEDEV